jgi:hypothetical protein
MPRPTPSCSCRGGRPTASRTSDAYRAIARGCWMEVVGEPLAVSDPL